MAGLDAKTIDLNFEIEPQDAEVAFRRGYYQGAHDAIRAIETTPIAKIKVWIDEALAKWRSHDRVHDRGLKPPRP